MTPNGTLLDLWYAACFVTVVGFLIVYHAFFD
jgi:hypothetical protein